MQERNDMRGQLRIEVRDTEGRLVETQTCHNRIVLTGRYLVARLFGVDPATDPTLKKVGFLAVGTGAADPSDDQAQLGAEFVRKPIAKIEYADFIDKDAQGKDVKRVRATLTVMFDYAEANATSPLVEAGLFTDSKMGSKADIMYNRVTFAPVNKNTSFQLTLLWEIIF